MSKVLADFETIKKNRVSAYNPVNTFDARAKSNFVFELKCYVMQFKCLLFVLWRFFRKSTTLMTGLVLSQYPKVQISSSQNGLFPSTVSGIIKNLNYFHFGNPSTKNVQRKEIFICFLVFVKTYASLT